MELSFEMTKKQLEKFFQERPALSKSAVCKEAAISKGLLDMILREDRSLTDETVKKLLPILTKYGFK